MTLTSCMDIYNNRYYYSDQDKHHLSDYYYKNKIIHDYIGLYSIVYNT